MSIPMARAPVIGHLQGHEQLCESPLTQSPIRRYGDVGTRQPFQQQQPMLRSSQTPPGSPLMNRTPSYSPPSHATRTLPTNLSDDHQLTTASLPDRFPPSISSVSTLFSEYPDNNLTAESLTSREFARAVNLSQWTRPLPGRRRNNSGMVGRRIEALSVGSGSSSDGSFDGYGMKNEVVPASEAGNGATVGAAAGGEVFTLLLEEEELEEERWCRCFDGEEEYVEEEEIELPKPPSKKKSTSSLNDSASAQRKTTMRRKKKRIRDGRCELCEKPPKPRGILDPDFFSPPTTLVSMNAKPSGALGFSALPPRYPDSLGTHRKVSGPVQPTWSFASQNSVHDRIHGVPIVMPIPVSDPDSPPLLPEKPMPTSVSPPLILIQDFTSIDSATTATATSSARTTPFPSFEITSLHPSPSSSRSSSPVPPAEERSRQDSAFCPSPDLTPLSSPPRSPSLKPKVEVVDLGKPPLPPSTVASATAKCEAGLVMRKVGRFTIIGLE
ncbi:hypothetical protein HDU97_003746 [Phlyctochytrium planicorne]|nr:hypothetical protein HDU97_003746 [Phlyctochytrium planicorne]